MNVVSIGFVIYLAILVFNGDYTIFILFGIPIAFNLTVIFDPNTFNLVLLDPYTIGYLPIIFMTILYSINVIIYLE